MTDTSGYSTDQWFNNPLAESSSMLPDLHSNPAFKWPGPYRRELDVNGDYSPKLVQRGFIKMLTATKGKTATADMEKMRCFFQFNPASIVRAVPMRSEMANPLLQDPSQFSVPVPGNQSFAFDLLFDRSFELNNQFSDLSGFDESKKPSAASAAGIGEDEDDPLFNASPKSVGVLADLRMLDAIVGQGISSQMIDYMLERGEITSSWSNDLTVTTTTSSDGTDATTDSGETTTATVTNGSSGTWDTERARTFLERNVGNQAFLLPNPVRVVFSSLFMVDGFVTNMSVNFLKFNEAMVPMQCSVQIQMSALYFGFTRKDTYLTYSLEQATAKAADPGDPIGTAPPATAVDSAAYQALIKYFQAYMQSAVFSVTTEPWTATDLIQSGDSDYKSGANSVANGINQVAPGVGGLFNLTYAFWGETDTDYYASNAYQTASPPTGDEEDALWSFTVANQDWLFPMVIGSPELKLNGYFRMKPKGEQGNGDDKDPIEAGFADALLSSFSYNLTIKVERDEYDLSYLPLEKGRGAVPLLEVYYSFSASTLDSYITNRTAALSSPAVENAIGITGETGRYLDIAANDPKTVWRAHYDEIIPATKARVSLELAGTMTDTTGNTLPFFARALRTIGVDDLLYIDTDLVLSLGNTPGDLPPPSER